MKRPLALTITGWFFIFAGLVGFAYHFYEHLNSGFDTEAILVLIVRVAAIIGGVLVLKAYDIGRWLLLAWMAYHVVLSFYHDVMQVLTHSLFLIILLIIFFHPRVRIYFRKVS